MFNEKYRHVVALVPRRAAWPSWVCKHGCSWNPAGLDRSEKLTALGAGLANKTEITYVNVIRQRTAFVTLGQVRCAVAALMRTLHNAPLKVDQTVVHGVPAVVPSSSLTAVRVCAPVGLRSDVAPVFFITSSCFFMKRTGSDGRSNASRPITAYAGSRNHREPL